MTIVPVLIVRFAGLNAKFLIVIVFDPFGGAVVMVGIVAGLCEEVHPEKKHMRISMIAHADQNETWECEVIVSLNAVRNKKYSLPDSIKRDVQEEVSSYMQQHHYSTKWWVRFITSRYGMTPISRFLQSVTGMARKS